MRFLNDFSYEIKEEELVIVLGGENENSGAARKLIQDHPGVIAEGKEMARPRAVYDIFEVDKVEGSCLYLGPEEYFKSRLFAHFTPGAELAALCITTIGEDIEEKARNYMQSNDYVKGTLLDAVGNLMLQKTELEISRQLRQEAEARGLKSSVPLSPGQVGWQMDDQKKIYSRLDAEQIGVTISESNILHPGKSASMLVGMGKDVIGEGKACDFCHLRDTCPSRMYKDYSQKKHNQE